MSRWLAGSFPQTLLVPIPFMIVVSHFATLFGQDP
jgi:hypothetical protein